MHMKTFHHHFQHFLINDNGVCNHAEESRISLPVLGQNLPPKKWGWPRVLRPLLEVNQPVLQVSHSSPQPVSFLLTVPLMRLVANQYNEVMPQSISITKMAETKNLHVRSINQLKSTVWEKEKFKTWNILYKKWNKQIPVVWGLSEAGTWWV